MLFTYRLGKVGWVTQLVVSRRHRRRYIATSLLQQLKDSPLFHGVTAVGLVSSHPAACHALSKCAGIAVSLSFSKVLIYLKLFHCPGTSIHSIDTSFCKLYAPMILAKSPVEYIKDMSLRGSLFHDDCKNGTVSSVFTNFYIDHAEPLEALHKYNKACGWVLGGLVDGHEFFVLLPTRTII